MSDILIKNMEKPKNCTVCPFCKDMKVCLVVGGIVGCKRGKHDNCPLVEYPTDFIKKIVQDFQRLSDKVHEL